MFGMNQVIANKKTIEAKWVLRNDMNQFSKVETPFLALEITKVNGIAISSTENLYNIFFSKLKKLNIKINEVDVNLTDFLSASQNPTGAAGLAHIPIATALSHLNGKSAEEKEAAITDFPAIYAAFDTFINQNPEPVVLEYENTINVILNSDVIPDGASAEGCILNPRLSTPAVLNFQIKDSSIKPYISKIAEYYNPIDPNYNGPQFPPAFSIARIDTAKKEELKSTIAEVIHLKKIELSA